MRYPARVLVMDGEEAEAERLAGALDGAGYVVAVSMAPADAARRATAFRPDLLMLEMAVEGGMDGIGLAHQLRASADPLLMFVTRDDRVSSRLAGYAAGADDYVIKPYVLEELLARVQALLRRAGRAQSQVRQVGPLVVDEAAHRVLVGDRPVDLGPTGFALLTILARHPGRVLSKRHLLDLVWGHEVLQESRVEVHMSILRRQLGREAASLIRTVRGVGYVLRTDERALLQDS